MALQETVDRSEREQVFGVEEPAARQRGVNGQAAVPFREDEPIALRPLWIARVDVQDLEIERGDDFDY
jgi:hypothetical protein